MYSKILFIYLSKYFIKYFIYITLGFLLLIIINSTIHTVVSSSSGVPSNILLGLIIFPIPNILLIFSPLIFVFSAIFTYLKLNNTQESTIIFSYTLSPGFFVLPLLSFVFLYGIFYLFIAGPFALHWNAKYLIYKSYTPNKQTFVINTVANSVWIFDRSTAHPFVIYSQKITNDMHFHHTYIFFNIFVNKPMKIYYAEDMTLTNDKYWNLKNVIETEYKHLTFKKVSTIRIFTNLNTKIILNNIKDVTQLSFMQLINTLKNSKNIGVDKKVLWVQLIILITNAFFSMTLVLLAAFFLMYLPKRKRAIIPIVLTVVLSICIYTMMQIIQSWFSGNPSRLSFIIILIPAMLSAGIYYSLYFRRIN